MKHVSPPRLPPTTWPYLILCLLGAYIVIPTPRAMAKEGLVYDLYSESYTDLFRHLATNSSRLRLLWPVNTWISPYAGLGLEYSAPMHRTEIERRDPWSYGYGGLGLKLGLPPVQLYLESRLRRYADDQENKKADRDEHRALLVLSYWWEQAMNSGDAPPRWFLDFYSETLGTTADRDNIIHTSYLRGGARFKLSDQDWLDTYARPYLARDRHRYVGNNREELELGARVTHSWSEVAASLGGGYVVSNRPPSPHEAYVTQARRQDGWRWYFIIGGAL